MKFTACWRFFATHGNNKKYKSDHKHDSERADPKTLIFSHVCYDTDQQRPHESRTFAENIIDPEVFPRFLRRNDLCKVRARHSLNCTLKQPYADGKDPKFIELIEKHSIDRNKEIRNNASHDQILRLYFPRKHAQQDRRRKSYDLRYEQSNQKHRRIQSQRRSVSGRHIDDRIDPVNEKEKRDKKEKNFFI